MNGFLIVFGLALVFYLLHRARRQIGSSEWEHEQGPREPRGGETGIHSRRSGAERRASSPMSTGAMVLLVLLLALPLMALHGVVPADLPLHGVLFWPALLLPIAILSYLWTVGALPGSARVAMLHDAEQQVLQDEWREEHRVALEPLSQCVAREMDVEATHLEGPIFFFEGRLLSDPEPSFERLTNSFAELGRSARLMEGERGRSIVLAVPGVVPRAARERPDLRVPLLLLVGTLGTTVWAGAAHQGVNLWIQPGRFLVGLPYALALLAILLVHEMGHFLAARYHGVNVTLPYFIPVPMGLGTFGAFIQIKGAIPDRRKLFDIGVAGPLAGLALALPALFWGLKAAQVVPSGPGVSLSSSVLLAWLYGLANGSPVPPDHVIRLSAIGFAGWLGLLVTALNLVPVGQLDGGHVAYALFGRQRSETLGWVSFFLLLALGVFFWSGWLNWALLIFFLGGAKHQPALNELPSPGRGRQLVGAVAFAVLFLIMAPVPHRFMAALGISCPYV